MNQEQKEQFIKNIQFNIDILNSGDFGGLKKYSLQEFQEKNAFDVLKESQKKLKRDEQRKQELKNILNQKRIQILTKQQIQYNDNDTKMIEEISEITQIKDSIENNQNKFSENVISHINPPQIRRQYNSSIKAQVVDHAMKYSTQNAAFEYQIPFETIRKWRKKANSGEPLSDNRVTNRAPYKYEEISKYLISEIFNLRSRGIPVSFQKIINVAHKFSKENNLNEFKPSKNWFQNLLKRNNLCLRKKTNSFVMNQQQIESIVYKFIQQAQTNQYYRNYDLILNMDESPFIYSNNQLYTYDLKGYKKINVIGGNEKEKLTVCLTIGIKTQTQQQIILKPFVIYKNTSKKPHSLIKLQNDLKQKCKISFSPSGWQNTQTLMQYCEFLIDEIKQQQPLNFRETLLVWDTYKVHENKEIINHLNRNNIEVLFIPGGTTGILQPLDLSIIRPLKLEMNSRYIVWQQENMDINSISIIPSKQQFLKWLIECQEAVNPEIIVSSFQKTGITMELDKLSILQLSSEIKYLCQNFVDKLNNYLQQQAQVDIFHPYLDSFENEIQDLFFNDIVIDKAYEFIQNNI